MSNIYNMEQELGVKLIIEKATFEHSKSKSLERAKELNRGEKVKPSRASKVNPEITLDELLRQIDEYRRRKNLMEPSYDDIDRIIKEARAIRKQKADGDKK